MVDNKEIARQFLSGLQTDGFAAIAKFCSDDYIWWAAGFGEIQDHLSEHFLTADDLDGPLTLTILDVISDGDQVAVEMESCGRIKNGSVYNNFYHMKMDLKDGKIVKIREYHDTKHAHDIIGHLLPPQVLSRPS